ncbi:MAG: carboxylating nicotinate-nucleotide diphosphorylase [Candidatus Omnitrophota bacterium]
MLSVQENKNTYYLIKNALKEDGAKNDISSRLSVSNDTKVKAAIFAKEGGILCGIKIAKAVFEEIDKNIVFNPLKTDGAIFRKDEKVAIIEGKARSILAAERVALNFLSQLCGTASFTKKFVEKVKGSNARILDTRKTTPLLRNLEKYAVRAGGGYSHRSSLSKGVMLKDNHLKATRCVYKKKINTDKLKKLIIFIRGKTKIKIEVEVETLSQFKEAVKCGPDIIMLDNFSLKNTGIAVGLRNKFFPKIKLEASGGVNLNNVKDIAYTGIDFISIGRITHSPPAVDFSLEILQQ